MIDIVTQLRSYQHASNIRGEVRVMAGRAADEIDRLRAERDDARTKLAYYEQSQEGK